MLYESLLELGSGLLQRRLAQIKINGVNLCTYGCYRTLANT